MPHPLDSPAWGSLTGRHAALAVGTGRARRFLPDVAPFAAVDDPADPAAWAELARVVGDAAVALMVPADPPAPWRIVRTFDALQLVEDHVVAREDPDVVVLGSDDVPAMLDLTARTRPGPFFPRTIELGRYLGVRDGDRLVAMAGERMQPEGWTEISAVCTDPTARGRGLAARLIAAVAAGIHARGDRAYLHVQADNPALALYERLGFVVRRPMLIRDCSPVGERP